MTSLITEKTENNYFNFEKEKNNESISDYYENIDIEEEKDINIILKELNKSIQINLEYNYFDDECKELIFLLEKEKKNEKKLKYSNKKKKNCPFKSLKKPKIISMSGRILSDCSSNETQYSSQQCIKGIMTISI